MIVRHRPDGMVREFTHQEAELMFVPILRRVFVNPKEPGTVYGTLPLGTAAFQNPTWKIVAFHGTPTGPIFEAPMREQPERYAQYLHSEPLYRWDELRPLCIALLERNIFELIHMGTLAWVEESAFHSEDRSPDQSGFNDAMLGAIGTFPLSRSFFQAAGDPVMACVHGSSYIFSRDASWGIWGDEDNFSVLGGEPDLIDRVLELGGGEAFWRRNFDDWVIENQLDRNNAVSRDYLKRLYACARWEPPDYIAKDLPTPPHALIFESDL